jgi:capsular polysaccharide export protein
MFAPADPWQQFKSKHLLLLQGPVGSFFERISNKLITIDCKSITKINFNGGDWWHYRRGRGDAIHFRGNAAEWPHFCARVLRERSIDAILLFGDCRPLHRAAIKLAQQHDVQVWVFEEGYIRPNYLTLERSGVNGFSQLPRDRAAYDNALMVRLEPEQTVGATFGASARQAMVYYAAALAAKPFFWHYEHHRPLSFLDSLRWVRSYARKLRYARRESAVLGALTTQKKKRFFLVVLQVSQDSQLRFHSRFESVEAFIREIASSFALNAPNDSQLVMKHHPLDRAYTDYSQLIAQLKVVLSLGDRLQYIHDQHLPTLLSHARGVVTVNSTVGLSAVDHATPVKVLGTAIYDIEGLTFQGALADFWTASESFKPDMELLAKFRNYTIAHTQLNGSVYKSLPGCDASGVLCPVREE